MPTSISALACPQCGGSVKLEQRMCSYCGINVVLSVDQASLIGNESSCPTCLTHYEPGERFCGRCAKPLLMDCPSPGCRATNSVWRKYCSKCGIEMEPARQQIQIKERMVNLEQLSIYENDLQQIYGTISKARSRERAIKYLIGLMALVAGLMIGLLSPTFGIIVALILLLFAFSYRSDEVDNLESSLEVCQRRVMDLRLSTDKTIDPP